MDQSDPFEQLGYDPLTEGPPIEVPEEVDYDDYDDEDLYDDDWDDDDDDICGDCGDRISGGCECDP